MGSSKRRAHLKHFLLEIGKGAWFFTFLCPARQPGRVSAVTGGDFQKGSRSGGLLQEVTAAQSLTEQQTPGSAGMRLCLQCCLEQRVEQLRPH